MMNSVRHTIHTLSDLLNAIKMTKRNKATKKYMYVRMEQKVGKMEIA